MKIVCSKKNRNLALEKVLIRLYNRSELWSVGTFYRVKHLVFTDAFEVPTDNMIIFYFWQNKYRRSLIYNPQTNRITFFNS